MTLQLLKKQLLIFVTSILCWTTAFAVDDEEVRYYDVEIVVFKNIRVPQNRELNLPVSSPQKDEEIFDLSSAQSIEAGAQWEYEMLPSENLRLLDAVTKISRSERYQLLLHTGWRQPGLERGKSIPVWIRGGRVYGNEFSSIDNQINQAQDLQKIIESDDEVSTQTIDDNSSNTTVEVTAVGSSTTQLYPLADDLPQGGVFELEGKISIALSRYLHANVDLVLRRPRLSSEGSAGNLAMQQILLKNQADTRVLNNHPLQEHRRMRSKTLHYLDSPYYAMLIEIHQYDPDSQIIDEVIPVEVTPEEEATTSTTDG